MFFDMNRVLSKKSSSLPTHYYNNVPYTRAPCYISLTLFVTAFATVCGSLKMSLGATMYLGPIIMLLIYISTWITELTVENFLGQYNKKIVNSLFFASLLFLSSEIFLFVGFSWVLLDRIMTNASGVPIAGNLLAINCIGVPLFGTGMLLSSGYYLNLAYCSMRQTELYVLYNRVASFFGITFLTMQFLEYQELFVRIPNTVYTSIFYVITGFHGMHVCVGLIMMFLNDNRYVACSLRMPKSKKPINYYSYQKEKKELRVFKFDWEPPTVEEMQREYEAQGGKGKLRVPRSMRNKIPLTVYMFEEEPHHPRYWVRTTEREWEESLEVYKKGVHIRK